MVLALAGCPGNAEDTTNRCEGNIAVNYDRHCGFGPCTYKARSQDCGAEQRCMLRAPTDTTAEHGATQVAVCAAPETK
jgi:hypothetical protein